MEAYCRHCGNPYAGKNTVCAICGAKNGILNCAKDQTHWKSFMKYLNQIVIKDDSVRPTLEKQLRTVKETMKYEEFIFLAGDLAIWREDGKIENGLTAEKACWQYLIMLAMPRAIHKNDAYAQYWISCAYAKTGNTFLAERYLAMSAKNGCDSAKSLRK